MLISAENGDVDTVRSMLADIHDPVDRAALVNVHDNDGYSPLHRASYGGHLETAKVRPLEYSTFEHFFRSHILLSVYKREFVFV